MRRAQTAPSVRNPFSAAAPTGMFEDAFTDAPTAMALVALDGRVLRANRALCALLTLTAEQACGRLLSSLSDQDDTVVEARENRKLLDGQSHTYTLDKPFRRGDGSCVWVRISRTLVRSRVAEPDLFVAHIQDISWRLALETRLDQLADHDELTALMNRHGFERALAQEGRYATRYGGGAVLMLDLDHFKDVNDQFGHKAGDDLLRTTARTIRQRLRETDVLARLGGDEFGIILPRVDASQAELVAAGIVRTLRAQPAAQGGHRVAITASLGIALFDGLTSNETLAAADLAMYDAKEQGRNRFVRYGQTPGGGSSRLLDVERIQRAVSQQRLELHGQPIRDLCTNQIAHYALVPHLRTETGALLGPAGFLGVAERFGAAGAIDAWVAAEAAALVATETRAGRDVTLHMQISHASIGDARVVGGIDQALAETGIDPARLVFTLSEAAVLGNPDGARSFTSGLRAWGCRAALSDVSTRSTSLASLASPSYDFLTFDGRSCPDAAVGVARRTGLKTVATSVSNRRTAERLRRSGVDYVQGLEAGLPQPVTAMFGTP